MLLEEGDRDAFKQWLLPKFEKIVDADAEVVAEFVIALVAGEHSIPGVRLRCAHELSPFLFDHTDTFVNDIANALERKSWVSGHAAKQPAQTNAPPAVNGKAPKQPTIAPAAAPIPSILDPSAEPYLPSPILSGNKKRGFHRPQAYGDAAANVSTGASSGILQSRSNVSGMPTGRFTKLRTNLGLPGNNLHQGRGSQSRKRKIDDEDANHAQDVPGANASAGAERPRKQVHRRGGKNGQGRFSAIGKAETGPMPNSMLQPPDFSAFLPTLSNGLPPIDQMNPTLMGMMAMASAFSALPFPIGGMKLPTGSVPEYDPNNALLGMQNALAMFSNQGKGYNNLGGTGDRDDGQSSAFHSQSRQAHDSRNSTVVVEQIPEESFREHRIRDFFTDFGTIDGVQLQAYNRTAIVRFADHAAALSALRSRKAVFEDRFVRVHWYKPEDTPVQSSSGGRAGINGNTAGNHDITRTANGSAHSVAFAPYKGTAESVDPEEHEKRETEAQRRFEENRKHAKEAAARRAAVDRQIQSNEYEASDLRYKLIEKQKAKGVAMIQEKGLKAGADNLSILQAEAEELYSQRKSNATTNNDSASFTGSFTAGGNGFKLRARGAVGRGAYRGRGAKGRSAVKRLDNRPKRVSVAQIEPGTRKDQTLRQHLQKVDGIASIQRHTEQDKTLVVTFSERYLAEIFLDQATRIPGVGKLKLDWVPNGVSTVHLSTELEASVLHRDTTEELSTDDGQDVMDGVVKVEEMQNVGDADLDVADDQDQWLR